MWKLCENYGSLFSIKYDQALIYTESKIKKPLHLKPKMKPTKISNNIFFENKDRKIVNRAH